MKPDITSTRITPKHSPTNTHRLKIVSSENTDQYYHELPLVICLDNCLIKSNLVHEQIIDSLSSAPIYSLNSLSSRPLKTDTPTVLKDRTYKIKTDTIPKNLNLLQYLKHQNQLGRDIHLVSVADESLVEQVAKEIGQFSSYTASSPNNKITKSDLAHHLVDSFPDGFAYAGSNADDYQIWSVSKAILMISVSSQLETNTRALNIPIELKINSNTQLTDWPKAARIHQWTKNLLLFAPLLLGPTVTTVSSWTTTLLGFLILCALTSGNYIINDIIDLTADRQHTHKQHRPIASGAISIKHSITVAILLITLALIAASIMNPMFFYLLCIYIIVANIYSLKFKKIPITDALVLSFLYTHRILIGAYIANVPVSFWILSFSAFFFFSLALLKRYVSITHNSTTKQGSIDGRGYIPADAPWVLAFGVSCSVASLTIVFQYIITEAYPSYAYSAPHLLWLIPALITLWIARIWMLAVRNELASDPVAYAIKDKTSLILGAALLITCIAARSL